LSWWRVVPLTQHKRYFASFGDHTRLKHLIVKAYFETWARKLLLRPGAGDTVYFVDAFAGEGHDAEGNPGSPVIAAEIASSTEVQFRRMKPGRLINVRTLAIEKNRARCRRLDSALSPYGDHAVARCGTLSGIIDEFREQVGDTPTLFFIDPFGVGGLDLEVVVKALAGPRNEVLALFADQAALRHFGAATAPEEDPADALRRAVVQPDLFEEVTAAAIEKAHKLVEKRIRQREATRVASLRIMNTAFGDDSWLPMIEALPAPGEERRTEFIHLYKQRVEDVAGARYTLTIPVRDERNRHVYHLVHASRHRRGRSAMKEVLNTALRATSITENAVYAISRRLRSALN
jgi:three-Cys-motif partner protein